MLRGPSAFNVVKFMVEAPAVAIEEAKADLLKIVAELISAPSLVHVLLMTSENDTNWRDFASSITKRVIVPSNTKS
jgi:hypothetical protein